MKTATALVLAAVSAMSACSTTPIQAPKAEGPAIVVVRDAGLVGSGCTFNVLIDGELAGAVKQGQSVTRKVSPGKHRVAIDNATALCPNVTMSKVVDVANDPAVFRIGITSNFQVIFDQVE